VLYVCLGVCVSVEYVMGMCMCVYVFERLCVIFVCIYFCMCSRVY